MAAPHLLGLPSISPDLKTMVPFLQRAEELKAKEPVMAYWCAYYAAQVGISMKAKDTQSRNLLFELLGVLESMKKNIGPNDAIDMEAASAAYVENFGLRIFAMADNEDRRGSATRSTAKKFLAAANFLEVLKVFPKTEISDSIEEKVKYAKWKAADISKAFRDGRKPAAGPAGQPEPHPPPPTIEPPTPLHSQDTQSSPMPSSQYHPSISSSETSLPPSPRPNLASLSPHVPPQSIVDPADIAQASLPHTPPNPAAHLDACVPRSEKESTPGSWSTAATPGNDAFQFGEVSPPPHHLHIDDHHSSTSVDASHHRKKSSVSSADDEMMHSLRSFPGVDYKKAVHFTPSVVGESPTILRGPKDPPSLASDSGFDLPLPTFAAGPVIPPPPPPFQTQPDPVSPTVYRRPAKLEASPSSIPLSLVHHGPHSSPQRTCPPLSAISAPPNVPVDLNPSVIAKAQKHCRFAISALDYEDPDQARKELIMALALLGVPLPS